MYQILTLLLQFIIKLIPKQSTKKE